MPWILFLLLTLLCCNGPSASTQDVHHWQAIAARDEGTSLDRPLIYRACVPIEWSRQDPPANESIADTTKPNCTFHINEGNNTLRITLHTFPIIESSMRVPPYAQIARWKRQIEDLDLLTTNTSSESYGGFSGLFFEGQGLVQGTPTRVMGWSMQLASSYERQLNLGRHPHDLLKRADYTIKASGAPEMMDRHRQAIIAFAQSFELIEELPPP